MKVNHNKFYSVMINSFTVLLILFAAGYILFSDISKLISNTPDDASYYLKIAGNFTLEKGFTFDNINNTNGFQPLWEYLLIPAMLLADSQPPENKLRIILLVQLVLISISLLIFNSVLRKFFQDKYILAFDIFFGVFVFFNAINGMETSLMILMISLLLRSAVNQKIFETESKGKEFTWGIILGLLILSRLDMIFIAIGIALIFMTGFRKESLYRIIKIFAGTATILIPYLLFNYFSFGNIIPVSGYLKSGFLQTSLVDKLQLILKYRESYFFFCSLIYFAWYLIFKKRSEEDNRNSFLDFINILIITSILLFSYMLIYLNWVIFYWYFIPFALVFSVLACIVFSHLFKDKDSAAVNIVYSAVIIFTAFYWGQKIYANYSGYNSVKENNWNIESYKAASWMKDHSGVKDIMAMKDAGHFSFFSGRDVINLDGLVNDFEYQEVLKNKKLNEYLKNNNVKYLSQHAIWKRDDVIRGEYDTLEFKLISHKYSAESDPVLLLKKNEVYRSAPYYDDGNKAVFIIWKLDLELLNN